MSARTGGSELAADLGSAGRNHAHNFVFIDACFSGGLIAEMLSALKRVVGSTTCTRKGYEPDRFFVKTTQENGKKNRPVHRYDVSTFQHGAWTHEFLIQGLMGAPASHNVDLGQMFAMARSKYVRVHRSHGDQPCFFVRQDGACYNSEEMAASGMVAPTGMHVPPPQNLHLFDWLGTPMAC